MTNKRYVDQIDEFIYDKNNTSMPITLGTLILVCFCVLLLIIFTFTEIDLFQFVPAFNEIGNLNFVFQKFPYVFQIPLVVLIAGILGLRFSLSTVIIYILMGLFLWPVFAFGGGIGYIKTHFFGYILGYIPCVITVSLLLKMFNNYKGMLLSGVLGPVSVYITGLLYSFILLLFHQIDFSVIHFEIIIASLSKLPYDILLSLLMLLIVKPLRYFLWLVAGNTKKPRKKSKAQ